MKISEYLSRLDNWSGDDDRGKYLRPLLDRLCPISAQTLREFQNTWVDPDGTRFAEYVVAQNAEIKKCLQLELTELGQIVRQKFGLEPLTLDTEIVVEPEHEHSGSN